jgi:hypothetical protein
MAKRTTRPAGASGAVQPESAPGSAMTEPSPAPATPAPDPGPDLEPAAAAPSPSGVDAGPGSSAPTPGAWPDISNEPAEPHCPWCSAPLASTDLTTCPSCGAQLNSPADADVPGVTTIDVAALAWKAGAPPRRNRLLSWIAGDDDMPPADTSGASSAAVEPPSPAVRREMLRLELEAEGISLPHDAEPSGAEEAAAVAEAQPAEPGASDPPSGASGA